MPAVIRKQVVMLARGYAVVIELGNPKHGVGDLAGSHEGFLPTIVLKALLKELGSVLRRIQEKGGLNR